MLTVVTLLLLPAVLGMSIYRVCRLPRELQSRRRRINPRNPVLAALGFGVTYCALAAYTLFIIYTAARAIWTPPKSIEELIHIGSVGVAYPFVYLAFEWVSYYSVKPGLHA